MGTGPPTPPFAGDGAADDPGGRPTGQPYVLTGPRWPAGQTTLTWSFNDYVLPADTDRDSALGASLPEDLRELVREAMDAWERVCGVEFVEVGDRASADVRIGWQPYFAPDPAYESDGPGGRAAVAWTWSIGSEISRQAVAFDPAESWTDETFYDTALHELGHVLGIGHSDVPGVVMSGLPTTPYADPNPYGRDDLTADDVAAARVLWGPPGGNPPTDGNDRLDGTGGADEIDGLGGHDRIHGYGGRDTLHGGDGNDTLLGGDGDDTLQGGDGDDALAGGADDDDVAGGRGNDRIWGEGGHDTLDGGSGVDLVFGMEGDDRVLGGYGGDIVLGGPGDDFILGDAGARDDDPTGSASGDGGDRIWGEGGEDTIWGEGGPDFLAGGAGDDRLYGEGGQDYLMGESGNDRLTGGSGYDVLVGGSGDDVFVLGPEGGTCFGGSGADAFDYDGGLVWIMDPADEDRMVSSSGAAPVGLYQSGPHTAIAMSDGGVVWLAWTPIAAAEDLDFFG